MLCSSYSAMTYVRKSLVYVCIQFLLLWTFRNKGTDKRNRVHRLNVATEFKTDNRMDDGDLNTVKMTNKTFEVSNCTRKDNVVFIKSYYSGE